MKRFQNVEFKEAARLIEQHVDDAPILTRGDRKNQPDTQRREELVALWKRSQPITIEDDAGRYLNARTGIEQFPSCLRFSSDERYVEVGQRPTWHPAMIAKVDPSDAAVAQGERAALHRTYLSHFASKAEVASPRKMLGTMPTGAAVRLMPHAETLGIAEGIETTISASTLFNVPVWAALTAGLMQEWTPPPNVTTVFIFGDNDSSGTGQAAAYVLAQRLKAKGLAAMVEIPARTDQDWNDVYLSRLTAEE